MQIVEITDGAGRVAESRWLAAAEVVHRQLRPHVRPPYAESMARIFAGGARMIVVVYAGEVAGVAVFRVHENTSVGLRLYVDDLVVGEDARSRGIGKTMLNWLEAEARRCGCSVLDLDSGTERERAHRFYFNAGYTIKTFGFKKSP
jgi:GNAT superfamily N-acetyltransferase